MADNFATYGAAGSRGFLQGMLLAQEQNMQERHMNMQYQLMQQKLKHDTALEAIYTNTIKQSVESGNRAERRLELETFRDVGALQAKGVLAEGAANAMYGADQPQVGTEFYPEAVRNTIPNTPKLFQTPAGGAGGRLQSKKLWNEDTGRLEAYNFNPSTGEYIPTGMEIEGDLTTGTRSKIQQDTQALKSAKTQIDAISQMLVTGGTDFATLGGQTQRLAAGGAKYLFGESVANKIPFVDTEKAGQYVRQKQNIDQMIMSFREWIGKAQTPSEVQNIGKGILASADNPLELVNKVKGAQEYLDRQIQLNEQSLQGKSNTPAIIKQNFSSTSNPSPDQLKKGGTLADYNKGIELGYWK